MNAEGQDEPGTTTFHITITTDPPGLAIAGDVDFRSLQEFTAAVNEAIDTYRGDIHLDLSQLAFIEVSGMRVLAEASRQLARENRQLVLNHLAPHLQSVLQMVGWYQEPDESTT